MPEPDFHSDPWLDARLRNVPLPVNLLARLQEIGTAETQQLDRALREVPVPDGLLDRLRDISSTPQPRFVFSLPERLDWSGRRSTWHQLATAAAILLAVGLGSLAIVSVALKSVDRMATNGAPAHDADGAGLAKQDAPTSDAQLAQRQPGDRFNDPVDAATRRRSDDRPADQVAHDGQGFSSADFEDWSDPADSQLDDMGPRTSDLATGPPPALPKPGRPKGRQLQPEDIVAFRGVPDVLPDLDAVEVHIARGLTPPRVAGYDLLYQLRYGQHPFVDPAAHKELQTVQLPLVTSSASYRRAWRWLKEGRLPAAGDLRTEEFLAALDYGFPAVPAGKVAIRAAGGPAPLRDEGLSLLQVAVQAGPLPHEAHGPTELTIVLDMSTSMRRAERWTGVQAAFARLREAMGPGDRVTLIGYTDGPELLADSIGRDEAARLLSALQSGQPRRAANLAGGVLLACSMLPQPDSKPAEPPGVDKAPGASSPKPPASSLLIISSGRIDSDSQVAERARTRLAELAKAGLGVQVLDLGRDNSLDLAGAGGNAAAGNAATQNKLAAWAQAGKGRLVRVADPSTLSWNLLEALIGRSPVVAARTSLRVSFNPKVVASYRLIGHERVTITGPSLAQTDVDLRAGESASGLFEVWLRPGNVSDNVATVDVEWQQPGYGDMQHLKQTVARSQFARSFSAASPSLQAAALAALTAETLRGSPFAPASRSLAHVFELTREVSSSLQAQPTFRELTQFIRQAEDARTKPAAAERKAKDERKLKTEE